MKIPIIHWTLKRTLTMFGFWPNKTSYIGRFFLCSTLVTTLPFQLWSAFIHADNLPIMLDVLRICSEEIFLHIKFFIMCYNQRYVYSLIEELAEDWKSLKLSVHEEKIQKYVKYAYRFCIFDYGLYVTASTSHCLESLILYITKSTEERKLGLESVYPFDYQPSPIFEIVTIIQWVQVFLLISADSLCEMLLGILVFHAGSQIEILVSDMDAISAASNSISDRNFVNGIMNIVTQHKKLITMLNKIETIYSYVFLVQFISSTLVICVSGYVILNSMGAEDIHIILMEKLVMYIILMLWQAFAFCFAGEFLTNMSLRIPECIYNCSWYELKPKNTKLLIIMLMRSQQPLQLTVGKVADLSINSFAQIVKTSASYLSVLRTMY